MPEVGEEDKKKRMKNISYRICFGKEQERRGDKTLRGFKAGGWAMDGKKKLRGPGGQRKRRESREERKKGSKEARKRVCRKTRTSEKEKEGKALNRSFRNPWEKKKEGRQPSYGSIRKERYSQTGWDEFLRGKKQGLRTDKGLVVHTSIDGDKGISAKKQRRKE